MRTSLAMEEGGVGNDEDDGGDGDDYGYDNEHNDEDEYAGDEDECDYGDNDYLDDDDVFVVSRTSLRKR